MKKTVFLFLTIMGLIACSDERPPFNYRGLPFTMSVDQLVDSMLARGFAVDSAASDSGRTVVLANPSERYRVLVAFKDTRLQAIQDTYSLSTNDSTRRLWQETRDRLEKELGAWPDCPMLKDNHKIANFDASDGFISVILENTYRPTLTVRYLPKHEK